MHFKKYVRIEDQCNKTRNVAWVQRTRGPTLSQAWGRVSSPSAWWLGYSWCNLAGPSLIKRHKAIPHWAHHLQGDHEGSILSLLDIAPLMTRSFCWRTSAPM
ncbi:hypothetical protein ILYODFUR_033500 [Ilyodon furcidens]|uniref:Uncharacterized protein n=1 Tax=Ilyodon furcidens TaxID=33524 RepID=A0ABV0VAT6_9TELE